MDDGPHDEADICFDMIIVVELYSEMNIVQQLLIPL